jgi:protein-S-isoprenylcysteine O-methyltransferase Ste14
MWVAVAALTAPWRGILLYARNWAWIPAAALFGAGLTLYKLSHQRFTLAQLGGLPEVLHANADQRLVTTGIRGSLRHPVYVGHLCAMLAWSIGTGLAVCWALTGFAIVTGATMIRMEEQELEQRFGEEYRRYCSTVPAVLPRMVR